MAQNSEIGCLPVDDFTIVAHVEFDWHNDTDRCITYMLWLIVGGFNANSLHSFTED